MVQPKETRPKSAVSSGVGLAGMLGLGLWILVARHYGMDGPHAGIAAVLACGLPMVLWSVLVDKVHRRPTTGIDWARPKPLRETFDISLIKIAGLWATWGVIALCYMTAHWYWQGPYRYAMDLLAMTAPWLAALSIPYVFWLDRRLIEPRDGAYALGQWLLGGAAGEPAPGAIADHARAWAVKGFFLAFMLSIVPGNFADMVHWHGMVQRPADLANFLIALMFVVDVAFATVGYMLTCRPLDAHIRSANPYLEGWLAALVCYPPFVLMGPGGPLYYQTDTRDWSVWLAGHDGLLWTWGAALVLLTGVYAWATVAFGPRFSNLTHRGILTHGPYALTRHPAYLAKNAFWWLSVLPFLVTDGNPVTAVRNTALLGVVSAIYYWRARTEERHLSADPYYRAYAMWMDRHGPIPRLMAMMRRASDAGLRRPA